MVNFVKKIMALMYKELKLIYTRGVVGGRRVYFQKNWVGMCGPLPKTPTLFMTKISDISYPFYDLTKHSKPYL